MQSHTVLTKFPPLSFIESPNEPFITSSSLAGSAGKGTVKKQERMTIEKGKRSEKEDSPGQGAPTSCHPGDGPDSASLLSSGEKTKKKQERHLLTCLSKVKKKTGKKYPFSSSVPL